MASLRSRIMYQVLKHSGSPFDARISLAQQRLNVERQGRLCRMPRNLKIETVSVGRMAAEWIKPRQAQEDRAVLYLHGGGYTMGSCSTHRALTARIAAASQSLALLIAYRLAPESPFPAALEDALRAYQYLQDQSFVSNKIVIAGDSAGGGLAVATALSLREKTVPQPAGIVCISPWADLTLSGESMVACAAVDPLIGRESSVFHARHYIAGSDPCEPLISPVYANFSGLPPLCIQVGEYEVLRSDSTRLAERARRAGVEVTLEVWEGMWHVWHMLAGYMPESQKAIEGIGAFIRKQMEDK